MNENCYIIMGLYGGYTGIILGLYRDCIGVSEGFRVVWSLALGVLLVRCLGFRLSHHQQRHHPKHESADRTGHVQSYKEGGVQVAAMFLFHGPQKATLNLENPSDKDDHVLFTLRSPGNGLVGFEILGFQVMWGLGLMKLEVDLLEGRSNHGQTACVYLHSTKLFLNLLCLSLSV